MISSFGQVNRVLVVVGCCLLLLAPSVQRRWTHRTFCHSSHPSSTLRLAHFIHSFIHENVERRRRQRGRRRWRWVYLRKEKKGRRGNILFLFLSALPNPAHNIDEDEENEDKASGRQNLFTTRLLDAEQCRSNAARRRQRHRRH